MHTIASCRITQIFEVIAKNPWMKLSTILIHTVAQTRDSLFFRLILFIANVLFSQQFNERILPLIFTRILWNHGDKLILWNQRESLPIKSVIECRWYSIKLRYDLRMNVMKGGKTSFISSKLFCVLDINITLCNTFVSLLLHDRISSLFFFWKIYVEKFGRIFAEIMLIVNLVTTNSWCLRFSADQPS